MARISVSGTGYVGLVLAACLADLGNEVSAIDTDVPRIRLLRSGHVPLYEPGLKEAIDRNVAASRLSFTSSYREAIPGSEYAFIAVGTPAKRNGEADVSHVREAATAIADDLEGPIVVVSKSTVPIGTADLVSNVFAKVNGRHRVDVVSNPEFLREGAALFDFMNPDRVVIGAASREVAERVAKLYEPLGAPILITDIYTAEMIKYASNALLATKISFINEMGRISERIGADIRTVAEGVGLDKRIGPQFLEAGIGFGGSCLPKDVKALAGIAKRHGLHPELLESVMAINSDQRRIVIEKLQECLGPLRGRVVGLWGLAFKPNTDDLRDAPSIDIAKLLRRRGARVRAYDPVVGVAAKGVVPGIEIRRDAYAAARGADAVVLVTEWNEFRQIDLDRVRRSMKRPVLVDGRNIYDPAEMRRIGFIYRGIGRN
jgi:UDPglucose 6-dehydrogenase